MSILKRTIQKNISDWLKDEKRILSLMINGVRRCGKTRNITYMLNKLRPNNWIYFDLTLDNQLEYLKNITSGTVEEFYSQIKINANIEINDDTIIFIDEIQRNEQIYFFVKRYHDYISLNNMKNNLIISGSYIDSVIFNKNYKALTGTTEKITMYPLSFYEFLINIKHGEDLIFLVKSKILKNQPVDKLTHNRMLKLLNEYMIVGGFPLNVIEYLNNGLSDQAIKQINKYTDTIIREQKEDIIYGVNAKNSLKLQSAYEAIKYGFDNKGDKIKKFQFNYLKNDPSRYKGSGELNIHILSRSQVVLPIIRTLGKNCQEDPKKNYKLLYCDMAILNQMLDIQYDEGNNKGWIGEHFSGLELVKYGKKPLRYWYKPKENTNKPGYEIDYLINNSYPIEVKNREKSFFTKSLEVYGYAKKPIIISLKNFSNSSIKYINVPMYAIWLIDELIK